MEAKLSLLMFTLCSSVQYAHSQDLTRTLLPAEYYQAEGAVCLDGSPPGYYMRRGTGEGANKWVLHIIGGGWCSTTQECYDRAQGLFGSTNFWEETLLFTGIVSNSDTINPDFYNWNHVAFIYCDGGSFAGDREEPDVVQGMSIYYRGYRILQAIMNHLNEQRGLSNATDVILTGCSAGATGVFMHADYLATLIPENAKYRALSDGGYFFELPNADPPVFDNLFSAFVSLQNISEAINPLCRGANDGTEYRCLFAQVMFPYIATPTFVVNSQYDSDIIDSYMLSCIPPNCDAEESLFLRTFKQGFDAAVQPVLSSASSGYFLDTCYVHCQTVEDANPWNNFEIEGRSMQQAFGDWYFERPGNTRLKDCDELPCNPTCPIDGGAIKNMANPLAFLALFAMACLPWI